MKLAELGLTAFQALLPAAAALLGYLGTLAANWLKAHTHSAAAGSALDVLGEIVSTVVRDVEQTMAAQLKDKGQLTAEDAKALKQAALDKIKSYYGEKGLQLLAKSLKLDPTTVSAFVGSQIEKAVYDMKYPGQTALPPFLQGNPR